MESFFTTESLIIELLLVVSLFAMVVRRQRVRYTVALIVVGLLITFWSVTRDRPDLGADPGACSYCR